MKTPSARHRPARSGSPTALTPAMQQYVEQKAQAPDAILLFRMGDFYEMFYDDAKTAARVLGLALTSRSKADNPIPLAGIPYHALETYLTRLVAAGYKVAISEQVEDPKQAKGVVRREIVRIVTPGTLTDEAMLERGKSNYLAAVCRQGPQAGLAAVEVSTGEFWVQLCDESEAVDELVRLRPSELLVPETPIDQDERIVQRYRELTGGVVSARPAHVFDAHDAERTLHEHFGVATLEGFGFARVDASLCAAAAAIDYLAETQKTALGQLTGIRRREQNDFVRIDEATYRSLEIEQTLRGDDRSACLLHAVDRTSTAMGRRLLRRWIGYPLRDGEQITSRQDAIAELKADTSRLGRLRALLSDLADVERISARLGLGRASPRDLVGLGRSLRLLPKFEAVLEDVTAAALSEQRSALSGLSDLADLLERALRADASTTLREGGVIADGYNSELDELRTIGRDGQRWLAEFQARETERTGIPTLKVGYNKVFGYYIEVTHAQRDRVPADYVRRQTVRNAERYITDELKQYESKVLTAEDRAKDLEIRLFEELRRQAAEYVPRLQQAAGGLATIDVLAGLAQIAIERRYCRPEVADQNVLEIVDGRHPVLEQALAQRFVPNDCQLDEHASRLALITGPNMAGKSTYIRQVALLVLLAQTGSFVPARSMRFGLVDRIFTRVGASDEIARGQSTFMVEMVETANILNNATEASLVVLDEVGRGTSTYDGLALAWAITEHIAANIGCRTLFATHYHELTDLADLLEGVVNYNVAVREWQDQVVFLYRIMPGRTDKSYGIHVAQLAGVPQSVVARSRTVLAQLEQGFSRRSQEGPIRDDSRSGTQQMWLFGDPQAELLDRLGQIDADQIAPIQALQTLRDLGEQARRLRES
ncbi:MAG TPA: DNA mismatch repair protein MutS [Phycisphaerae bacterium]|nr:DNA mismatch repair protein MutS [Phycisphaerae bacterium]